MDYTRPADIERESMEIIAGELRERGVVLPPEQEAVVKRVIHATADFEYEKAIRFTDDAVQRGVAALRAGVIVTDTNMALAGISKAAMKALDCAAYCYMADAEVAAAAKARGSTRAAVSMERALAEHPRAILAIGNAPTALLRAAELIEAGARPALVVGVPVGFVNVVESKERALASCVAHDIPAIVALGRKGGSAVAAAICNALLYTASGMLDPAARG